MTMIGQIISNCHQNFSFMDTDTLVSNKKIFSWKIWFGIDLNLSDITSFLINTQNNLKLSAWPVQTYSLYAVQKQSSEVSHLTQIKRPALNLCWHKGQRPTLGEKMSARIARKGDHPSSGINHTDSSTTCLQRMETPEVHGTCPTNLAT